MIRLALAFALGFIARDLLIYRPVARARDIRRGLSVIPGGAA